MKLLRVLQEREFERVGDRTRSRWTCASSPRPTRIWRKMVADGTFREDLFYRLNVIPVQLPPLRERRDDIPLLVQHFLAASTQPVGDRGRRSRSPGRDAAPDGLRLARQRAAARKRRSSARWRCAAAARRSRSAICRPRSQAVPAATPTAVDLPDAGIDLPLVGRIERDLIQRALARTSGNRDDAARCSS